MLRKFRKQTTEVTAEHGLEKSYVNSASHRGGMVKQVSSTCQRDLRCQGQEEGAWKRIEAGRLARSKGESLQSCEGPRIRGHGCGEARGVHSR